MYITNTQPLMPTQADWLETAGLDTTDKEALQSSLGLTLTLHRDLTGLAQPWRDFQENTTISAFQYYDFITSWMQSVGQAVNVEPLIVIGQNQDGSISFILPFCLYKTGVFKTLRCLGMKQANFQHGLYSDEFLSMIDKASFKTLWREIKKLLPSFDCLHFTNQARKIGKFDNPFLHLGDCKCPDEYYLCDLMEDFDELLLTKHNSKARKNMRRHDRHLDELGEVTFQHETDPTLLREAMEAVVAEKNRQLARIGRPECFPDEVGAGFLSAAMSGMGKKPALKLFTLRLNGELLAAMLLAPAKEVCHGLVLFMYKGEYSKHSPGDRVLRESFKWACENGFKTFDLSLGKAAYKNHWADKIERPFETLKVNTTLGLVYALPNSCKTKIKKMIKSSQFITRLLTRRLLTNKQPMT